MRETNRDDFLHLFFQTNKTSSIRDHFPTNYSKSSRFFSIALKKVYLQLIITSRISLTNNYSTKVHNFSKTLSFYQYLRSISTNIKNETLFSRNFKYSTIDPFSRRWLQLEIGQVRSKTRLVREGGASCRSNERRFMWQKCEALWARVSRGKRQ